MAPGFGLVFPGGTGIVEKLCTFPVDVLVLHREGTTFISEKSRSFVEEERWDLWKQELLGTPSGRPLNNFWVTGLEAFMIKIWVCIFLVLSSTWPSEI